VSNPKCALESQSSQDPRQLLDAHAETLGSLALTAFALLLRKYNPEKPFKHQGFKL